MMTLMSNLKFRLLWIYTTNRLSKFYTIYSARLATKCFVEWNCLALILSEKISDDMYSSLHEFKNKFPKMVLAQFPLGCQLLVSFSDFQHENIGYLSSYL